MGSYMRPCGYLTSMPRVESQTDLLLLIVANVLHIDEDAYIRGHM